ncbi:transcriptional regulator [Pseudomonas sp. M47T1]|uniref:LysR substrate-binding domain-containing protein n=1 Tax=Pseudomonas sp. M47T1 TaxID=1179778 RepID=UPI0002607D51|nr:LysR substrate-binding domain-containing protein [Pseudomonas sp. M47T1]EIK97194.1 transcriptional regulator [Pseudomonas sp. M47T1]
MIRELKTLVAVAQEGTFAAAGHKIGLTQAAVSAQVQRLESELGFELFDRSGRTAHLNRRGQHTLRQAQELIRLYHELGSAPHGSAPSVLVNIGAIASVQRSLLPQVLATFHARFPQCRTRILPGLSMDLVNLVDTGDLDMALMIRPPFSLQSDLRWTTLIREPYRLWVPEHLANENWQDLLRTQPFIRYDRSSFGGRQVDRFLRHQHLVVHEKCELDELEAIVSLVGHGMGVALVPQTASHAYWPANVTSLDLGHHTFHRDIGLVHRGKGAVSDPVRALIEIIHDAVGLPSSQGDANT